MRLTARGEKLVYSRNNMSHCTIKQVLLLTFYSSNLLTYTVMLFSVSCSFSIVLLVPFVILL